MNHNFYPVYYHSYISKVPEGNPMDLFSMSLKELLSSLAMVSDQQANESYAEGKWSIKEILQHLIDTERIFSFRALAFARGDQNEIQGYDHEAYAEKSNANQRTLKSLLEELKELRTSTQTLFQSFSSEMLQQSGIANGQKLKVEQLQYIIIGHEMHHLSIIEQKYLYS